MTDPGWIVAPLMMTGAGMSGDPLLLYDGAPDFPNDARVAQLLTKHDVSIFGASPTFVRSLMGREGHGFDGEASNLRVLVSSGEPWNEKPWWWFFDRVGGGRCPIINLSGGTEAGALLGVVPIRPLTPCCFNTSCIGVDADVVDDHGQPVPPQRLGELVVRQPWPGQTRGLWKDDDRYLESYWSQIPDVWTHGDWASRSEDGFWYLHGRSDDTIMIAGKRLGPAEVEGVLGTHPSVSEAAAVGIADEVKGEALWCFVVAAHEYDGLDDELRELVSSSLGKSFRPTRVVFVPELPKTRTGKIVRRAVKATVTGTDPGDLSALDNPHALESLRPYTLAAREG
jgi:acetyl-CoA synthetase